MYIKNVTYKQKGMRDVKKQHMHPRSLQINISDNACLYL